MQNHESAIQCFIWAEMNYEAGAKPLALFLFRKGVSHLILSDIDPEKVMDMCLPYMTEECVTALESYNDLVSTDPVEYIKWCDTVSCLFHM